jgi:hypothetical protein
VSQRRDFVAQAGGAVGFHLHPRKSEKRSSDAMIGVASVGDRPLGDTTFAHRAVAAQKDGETS